MRTIVIGCDNAAVHLKNELMDFMEKKGYTVENMGCDSTEDSTYYPYVAEKVCLEIINSGYQKHGVLICGTGLGMAMHFSLNICSTCFTRYIFWFCTV